MTILWISRRYQEAKNSYLIRIVVCLLYTLKQELISVFRHILISISYPNTQSLSKSSEAILKLGVMSI